MEPLGATRTVERVAAYCRAEQLVFALLGDGASTVVSAPHTVTVLAAADHAAWRARRWFELLPTAPPGPDALLAPRDVDLETAAVARDHAVDESTLLAVVTLELLPRLRRAMEEHRDRCTPVADAAVHRILSIALTDLDTDLAGLLAAHESLLRTITDRQRVDLAAGAVAAVTARLAWPTGP